jgi:hypothetical protein
MKSGYGLEMRAAAVCREHLFHATTQSVPYRDPTEGDTTREADVVVQGGTLYGSDGVFWTLTVVIECKSPKGKPWVALLIPHTVSGSLSGALVEPVSPDRDALERLMDALKDFSPFASASYAEGACLGARFGRTRSEKWLQHRWLCTPSSDERRGGDPRTVRPAVGAAHHNDPASLGHRRRALWGVTRSDWRGGGRGSLPRFCEGTSSGWPRCG